MIRPVVSEAVASVRSQPVASIVTFLMIVGMILVIMLTTGRTVGAEQQVLSSIDSAGTRSITVRAEPEAGLTTDVLDRIAGIEGIEWSAGFSAAMDATNSRVPDGARVPIRLAYSAQLERLGVPAASPLPGELAWASDDALEQLGLPDAAGGVSVVNAGGVYGVGGRLDVPDFLQRLEPLVIVPEPRGDTAQINVLVVIAESPDLVAPVSDAVVSMLGVTDTSKVTVQTSEALANLRTLIGAQLGNFSRGLVVALLTLTGVLLAILLYGLVMMRRRDFGRRRALGATRGLIIALLLVQTAMLAFGGIIVGVGASLLVLAASGDPWPGIPFTAALAVLTVVAAMLAALLPAVIASRREPIEELRIP